jgi:hypothetical protein
MATTNNVIPNNKAPNNKAQNNNAPNDNGMFNDSLALHNIAEGRFNKMDKTNVPVLFESLNDDNPFFILNIIDELEKLSNTNPDDFAAGEERAFEDSVKHRYRQNYVS